MPKTTCKTCGSSIPWNWEQAFDKFGFHDGDGTVMTEDVVLALTRAGYSAEPHTWGCHNTIIISIKLKGVEQIPADTRLGYDNPRRFLPKKLVALLDKALPHEEVRS